MSLINFKAKNHPQQEVDDEVDDRRTDLVFFSDLNSQHQFTIDLAASHENALLNSYFTKKENALTRSWENHRCWCNPPFSRLEPWLEKAWSETTTNKCELVVMLLPANRCEQGWWQRHVEPFRDGRDTSRGVVVSTTFLAGRMRFKRPGWVKPTKGDRPPFGCVLVVWRRIP